jgi:hypothetical protein
MAVSLVQDTRIPYTYRADPMTGDIGVVAAGDGPFSLDGGQSSTLQSPLASSSGPLFYPETGPLSSDGRRAASGSTGDDPVPQAPAFDSSMGGWYLPVSTHLVQTSQSRWVALTSFSPDDFADDSQPTLVPQTGTSTADQAITPGSQTIAGRGDTLTVSPTPVAPGLADSEAFAELTKTPIPEKTSPLLDPAGLSPIGIPIDSASNTHSTPLSQGPAPETLVPTVQPLTVTSAAKDTSAEHSPSVSVLAARESTGTEALGDFGLQRSGTGNSTTAQDQGSMELLVLLAAVLLLAAREWFRTGTPAQVVVPGMGGSSREPLIKTDGSAARDIREPDLATTDGLVSMDAAHLGAGVYLNPEDLYHLVVPGTERKPMTEGGWVTTPPQTDPQPPEPEHVSPPEFDPNAEPVYLVPTSKSVPKVDPPAGPAASPSQSSSSGSGSDGVERISLGPVSGRFFTQGVITTTDTSGSESPSDSQGSGGAGDSADSDTPSFYEDFSSSYGNSSSLYDEFFKQLSASYADQGFSGFANFMTGSSGLSNRDVVMDSANLADTDSDLSEDEGYWYDTEYRAGYDLSGEVPDFSITSLLALGTDLTDGWDFDWESKFIADSGMEDSEESGTTREEPSNEPSSETHNPEYFQEESDYALDSQDDNWVIEPSDGNEPGLASDDVGSDYEGDHESDEGNVPEFLDGNTEDSDVSPNAESPDSQTDQPGTVLPEDMSLEALSQFVNAGQYDASSIGPLATEVFDRLASLLPEGLGTSDSDEQFGVPNFVERLADGFQQGLGLSADEARGLAQQVADGIQGAIDEKVQGDDKVVGTGDDTKPPVILAGGTDPNSGSDKPDGEKEPTWEELFRRGLLNTLRYGWPFGGMVGSGSNLTQQQTAAIRKIDNAIRDHLKPDDISGALRDMLGNPVPKPGGGHYNHFKELTDTLAGLRKQARVLEAVNNPAAQAARQRALDAIQLIETTFKGAGI